MLAKACYKPVFYWGDSKAGIERGYCMSDCYILKRNTKLVT